MSESDDIFHENKSTLCTISATKPGLSNDLFRIKTEDELPDKIAKQIDGIFSQLCSHLPEIETKQLLAQVRQIILIPIGIYTSAKLSLDILIGYR